MICFFFSSRRRHTRSKRDWSSDVCSSDLPMRSHVENGTRKVGYVTTSAQIVSEMPSQTTTCDNGRNSRVGGTRYVMKTAVPNEPTPGKRKRARLYPARTAMTSEIDVAVTLMIRLFFIHVRKSVLKNRYR